MASEAVDSTWTGKGGSGVNGLRNIRQSVNSSQWHGNACILLHSCFRRVVLTLLPMLIGNGAMMVRTFPHGAVQFLSYEQYKQFLDSLCGKGALSHLLAGSLAGIPLVIKCHRNDGVKFTLSEFKLILV